MAKLSTEHQAFIGALFETRGNVREAAHKVGFSDAYGYVLVKTLREHIIEQAQNILALHAPKAAFALVDGVDNAPNAKPVAAAVVECAKQILDRVGIVKKEHIEIDATKGVALFILPPKDESPDKPTIEEA